MLRKRSACSSTSLDSHSEITALQGDLSSRFSFLTAAMQQRLNQVQAECIKSETNNEMLQSYIDSITKKLATKQ